MQFRVNMIGENEQDIEVQILELCTCDGPWGQQGCDIHRDAQSHSPESASIEDELFWFAQHY